MQVRLKFGQKIALLPGVAGVGAVAILITAVVLGGRSSEQLRLIEEGYYPSNEMSGELEGSMGNLQRSLQDAVAASDEDQVAMADSVAESIRSVLAVGQDNPLLDGQEIAALQERFEDYYQLARAMTLQMITGNGNRDLMAGLRQMTESISGINDELSQRSERDGQRIETAFAEARSLQGSTTFVTTTVLAILVGRNPSTL